MSTHSADSMLTPPLGGRIMRCTRISVRPSVCLMKPAAGKQNIVQLSNVQRDTRCNRHSNFEVTGSKFKDMDFKCRSTSCRSRDVVFTIDVVRLHESYLWIERYLLRVVEGSENPFDAYLRENVSTQVKPRRWWPPFYAAHFFQCKRKSWCVTVVQGHSRSSILVPIESPYATIYYCFRDITSCGMKVGITKLASLV